MNDEVNIFYGHNRTEAEARAFCKKHGIEITYHAVKKAGYDFYFLDFGEEDRGGLQAVIAKAKSGVNIYAMGLIDFGPSKTCGQTRKDIEATGAKIIIPKEEKGKRGRKAEHGLNAEQVVKYRRRWNTVGISQEQVVREILRDEGLVVNRYKLKRLFDK